MIPIELSLRNFLSYGENCAPLDFTSFHLACLSGGNGHGKSALLEAMTWAVWGEARKASYSRTPDADLLRLNTDHMSVQFRFQLNDREYRILRDYHRKRHSGKLEFYGRRSPNEDYQLLTGSTKRETQKRIINTLGLDYRTFINSSFLQQGKADEFTRQSPQDRKEILATILGLQYYEQLLEETKQHWSFCRAEIRNLEDNIKTIQQELTSEQDIQAQEKTCQEEFTSLQASIEHAQQLEKNLLDEIHQLRLIKDRIEYQNRALEETKKRDLELSQRIAQLEQEQHSLQEILNRRNEIEQQNQRLDAVNQQLNQLLEVEQQYREWTAQCDALNQQIEEARSSHREKLASLKSELQQAQQSLQETQPLLDQKDEIEQNHQRYQNLLQEYRRLESLRPEFENHQKILQELVQQINEEKQKLIQRLATLQGQTQRLPTLEQEIQTLNTALQQQEELNQRYDQATQTLNQITEEGQENNRKLEQALSEKHHGSTQLNTLHEKIHVMQQDTAHECPLCQSPLDESRKNQILQQFQHEIQNLQNRIQAREKEITERQSRRDELAARYHQQQQTIQQLERQRAQLHQSQQRLNELASEKSKLQQLEQECKHLQALLDQDNYAHELKAKKEQIQHALSQSPFDPQALASINQQLQDNRQHETQWERLQEALQRRHTAQEQIPALQDTINRMQQELDEHQLALPEQKQRDALHQQIAPLEKQLQQRKSLQQEQYQLRNALTEWKQLQNATERLPHIREELQTCRQQRQHNRERQHELKQEIEQSQPKLDELKQQEAHLQTYEAQRQRQEEQRNQVQYKLGALQERLSHLQNRRQEMQQSHQQLTQLRRDEKVYSILKTAFSRDGIPAMIVDQSLPELENDANRLLHRLSEGRCSLTLESQREKKSGGIAETLDIKISDELGTRDYEMFSGGEAFRTDLALRIALSQLLCRRAGSQLQLLVIDEGFGSQDAPGLNHVVDAIDEIKDEFEKILLVTHLEELKDKFMVRIEVTKEPGLGSRFEIIHTL